MTALKEHDAGVSFGNHPFPGYHDKAFKVAACIQPNIKYKKETYEMAQVDVNADMARDFMRMVTECIEAGRGTLRSPSFVDMQGGMVWVDLGGALSVNNPFGISVQRLIESLVECPAVHEIANHLFDDDLYPDDDGRVAACFDLF